MPSLNIRNIDVTLVTSLKQRALSSGMTLRAYCIGILEATHDRDTERHDASGVHGADQRGATGGSGKRTAVPVLPKAQGKAQHVHPVQSVREELVQRSGHIEASTYEACKAGGHTVFRAGSGWYCKDCGR